jgi:hypothetical protein
VYAAAGNAANQDAADRYSEPSATTSGGPADRAAPIRTDGSRSAGWRNANAPVADRADRPGPVDDDKTGGKNSAAGDGGANRSTLPLKPIAKTADADSAAKTAAPTDVAKPGDRERPSIARVTKGAGTLPNDHGQIWREYDITPYTVRVTTTKRPEQAIVDWILRETGYEAWHSEVVSVLSADQRVLRVYHTPEMQRLVSEMVDRFVNTQAETHAFGLRVVTIGSPNWREGTLRILKPIPVQSQGVQAWLLAKEDAALLLAQLSKRSDFREYTSPNVTVHNGQSAVVGANRARKYAKSVLPRPGVVGGFDLETGQIDEGYSLQLSPLLSLDGAAIDAVIKCNITQVEKMIPVSIEAPTQYSPQQRQRIEIPQVASCDLHERFRWPVDQVLLVSRGVVATPMPKAASSIPITFPGAPPANRADALLFIQSKGKTDAGPPAAATGVRPAAPARNGALR